MTIERPKLTNDHSQVRLDELDRLAHQAEVRDQFIPGGARFFHQTGAGTAFLPTQAATVEQLFPVRITGSTGGGGSGDPFRYLGIEQEEQANGTFRDLAGGRVFEADRNRLFETNDTTGIPSGTIVWAQLTFSNEADPPGLEYTFDHQRTSAAGGGVEGAAFYTAGFLLTADGVIGETIAARSISRFTFAANTGIQLTPTDGGSYNVHLLAVNLVQAGVVTSNNPLITAYGERQQLGDGRKFFACGLQVATAWDPSATSLFGGGARGYRRAPFQVFSEIAITGASPSVRATTQLFTAVAVNASIRLPPTHHGVGDGWAFINFQHSTLTLGGIGDDLPRLSGLFLSSGTYVGGTLTVVKGYLTFTDINTERRPGGAVTDASLGTPFTLFGSVSYDHAGRPFDQGIFVSGPALALGAGTYFVFATRLVDSSGGGDSEPVDGTGINASLIPFVSFTYGHQSGSFISEYSTIRWGITEDVTVLTSTGSVTLGFSGGLYWRRIAGGAGAAVIGFTVPAGFFRITGSDGASHPVHEAASGLGGSFTVQWDSFPARSAILGSDGVGSGPPTLRRLAVTHTPERSFFVGDSPGTVTGTAGEGTIALKTISGGQIGINPDAGAGAPVSRAETFLLEAFGVITAPSPAGSLNIRVYYGSTLVFSTGAQAVTGPVTTRQWHLRALMTFSGSGLVGNGWFDWMQSGTTGTPTRWPMLRTAAVVVDQTVTNDLKITAEWSGAATAASTFVIYNCLFTKKNGYVWIVD